MSLITCCPACGTMFKVVPDQLKVSEGWVRCGHCAEVFDATAHMQGGAPVQAPVQPAAQPTAQPTAQPEPQPQSEIETVDSHVPDSLIAAAPSEFEPLEPLEPSPLDQPFVVYGSTEFSPPPEALSVAPPEAAAPPAQDAPLEDVSFVRQARRKAFWRRPAVRAALLLACLVLAGLLALQWGVHDRDRIALLQPALKPWLERICRPLACTVGPPRQIEAIVIDASSFNKLRSDAYRLSLTLKNQAPTPVAVPALELTLTDTQDQPVVRRVLQPSDMGAAAGAVIAGGGDWSGNVALTVAGNGRISGYRVLAFYP